MRQYFNYSASGVLRALMASVSLLMIAFISLGTFSHAKPGTLTWGPTTDFWAMAIAISDIQLGMDGGLGRREIVSELAKYLTTTGSDIQVHDTGTQELDADPERVDEGIRAASAIDPSSLPDYALDSGSFITTVFEDIGYADFYDLAFRLFGFGAFSTHYLYLAILALSVVLFLLGHWRSTTNLAVLALATTTLFLTTTSDIFIPSLPSLAANRFLSTLAVIPLLHIAMTALDLRRLRIDGWLAFVGQLLLFAFAVHLRSSAAWMLGALLAMLVLVVVFRLSTLVRRQRLERQAGILSNFFAVPEIRRASYVVFAAMIAFSAYDAVRNSQLHLIYAGDDVLPHHLRWHSAMLGLSVHPEWIKRNIWGYGPDDSGDTIGFLTFEKYMKKHFPQTPFTSGVSRGLYKARLDDRVMKEEFLRFAVANPDYMFELYFYYKPMQIARVLGALLASIPPTAWLLSLPAILLASVTIASAPARRAELALFLLLLFLVSFSPLLWAYGAAHVVSDQVWLALMLICFFVASILSVGVKLALPSSSWPRKRQQELKIPEPAKLTMTVEPSADGYRLRDQELGLEAVGRDLGEAYRALVNKRSKVVSALDTASIPYEAVAKSVAVSRSTRPIGPIFLGVGVILTGLALLAYLALSPLLMRTERFLKSAETLVKTVTPVAQKVDSLLAHGFDVSAAQQFRGVTDGVHTLAEAIGKMTPEKRQQLREDLRTLAVEGRPFAEELLPLFEAPATAPPAAAQGGASEPPSQPPNSDPR